MFHKTLKYENSWRFYKRKFKLKWDKISLEQVDNILNDAKPLFIETK